LPPVARKRAGKSRQNQEVHEEVAELLHLPAPGGDGWRRGLAGDLR
jgi:hypothetical protein